MYIKPQNPFGVQDSRVFKTSGPPDGHWYGPLPSHTQVSGAPVWALACGSVFLGLLSLKEKWQPKEPHPCPCGSSVTSLSPMGKTRDLMWPAVPAVTSLAGTLFPSADFPGKHLISATQGPLDSILEA
ncbi:Hypothetical predicted protein [Marmota monax]|uniref:Uncharacterized protein n=1 Tax=Marmota monax TaxID=9995 RepID=A0A5E4A5V2_MARMO|nr:hypothetical protein GHT09_002557 [Marmota monax]VTJ52498.1 Hypothetical predicted protein [Marmota monax]